MKRAVSTVFNKALQTKPILTQVRQAHAAFKEEPIKQHNEEFFINKIPYENAMKEKEVDVLTCGALFEKWRKEKRFWTLPKNDIKFKVKYIDTGLQCDPKESPVVLALHGSPGSYKDFDPIISHLYGLGVRVISPLFPDLKNLNARVFRHTPEEKSEYVKDFLNTLHISKVDMVLCHSSALFPGQMLCLPNEKVKSNSLCLLNPTSFQNPRMMKPFGLCKFLIRLYEFPIGHNITKFAAKQLEKKTGLTKGTSGDNFFSAFTMVHCSIPKQVIHFEKLLMSNLPIMMAFSKNDKLIHPVDSLKMARLIVNEEEICRYNNDGKIVHAGGTNPLRRVLSFENGTHFVFKKHPTVISKAVSEFLWEHFDNRE